MLSSKTFKLLCCGLFACGMACSSNSTTASPGDVGGDPGAGGDEVGAGDAFNGDAVHGDAVAGGGQGGDDASLGDPGPVACLKKAEPCTDDTQCCNGSCVSGAGVSNQCAEPPGCTTRFEDCTGARQCCSMSCLDDGNGGMTCAPLGGCTPSGDICAIASTSSDECCSGVCELDGTVLRCANTVGCQATGEVCGQGASKNCGDPSGGGNDGSAWCVPAVSVDRCGSRCTFSGCAGCFTAGQACAIPEDCCSNQCLPSAGGPFTCDGI